MSALKRLVGAKDPFAVSQEDFSAGVGTYKAKLDAPMPPAMAAVKKEFSQYSIVGMELKLTMKVTQKKEDYYAGNIQLVKGTPPEAFDKLVELVTAKKTTLVIAGAWKEDDKQKQTLAISSAGEPDKKK